MSVIHPNMEVWAALRTKEPAPDLPELRAVGYIDQDISKNHPGSRSEIRIRLHEIAPERVVHVLQQASVRLTRLSLTPRFLPEFWDHPPEDCIGGLLAADGTVSLQRDSLSKQIVPLSEPLYISGRPEGDGEHSREKPHVIRAGGIPIVSDAFLAVLRQLGAEGETGTIIYRGSKKAAYDAVQPGFLRFLPRPQYAMLDTGGIDFLPEAVPNDFGICAMYRTQKIPPEMLSNFPPDQTEYQWYDIALTIERCSELLRLRPRTLLKPIFRRGGITHQWVVELEAAVAAMQA